MVAVCYNSTDLKNPFATVMSPVIKSRGLLLNEMAAAESVMMNRLILRMEEDVKPGAPTPLAAFDALTALVGDLRLTHGEASITIVKCLECYFLGEVNYRGSKTRTRRRLLTTAENELRERDLRGIAHPRGIYTWRPEVFQPRISYLLH